jgi:tetratricopeptide (TPR) repeat protein
MLNQLAFRLKHSFWLQAYIFCCVLVLSTSLSCFGQRRKNLPLETARNLILAENINEAIVSYAVLAKKTSDPTLIAEYAYALALGGIYDDALIQLDRVWFIGNYSSDVNYLAGQVFALMGFDDITNEIWKSSEKNKTPVWIESKSPILLEKYKTKISGTILQKQEGFIANFNRANELAAQHYYFQSIALFHEIVRIYPNEYFPFVYYSITLEKAGAIAKAAQLLEQAISVIGDNPGDKEKKLLLEQRLEKLSARVRLEPAGTFLILPKSSVLYTPHMMVFIGGQTSNSYTNLNFRIGYLLSEKFNYSFDLGVLNNKADSTGTNINFGVSMYARIRLSKANTPKPGYLIGGIGIQRNSSDGILPQFSIGYSQMINGSMSLDIISNISSNGISTTSIGGTIYF